MTRVERRGFIVGTLSLLAAPLAAMAQPAGKVYRLAIVATTLPVAEYTADPAVREFFVELRRLGYVEGQNLVVELRSALGRPERFPEIATEVVRLNPDVILAGSNRVIRAVKAATATIPPRPKPRACAPATTRRCRSSRCGITVSRIPRS